MSVAFILHLQTDSFLQRHRLAGGNNNMTDTLVPTGKRFRQNGKNSIIQRAGDSHIGIFRRRVPHHRAQQLPDISAESGLELNSLLTRQRNPLLTRAHQTVTQHLQTQGCHIVEMRTAAD